MWNIFKQYTSIENWSNDPTSIARTFVLSMYFEKWMYTCKPFLLDNCEAALGFVS